jgi:hypothetical protein
VPEDSVEVRILELHYFKATDERYYLAPSLDLAGGKGANFLPDAVVNIDEDTRKLPLQWKLYPNRSLRRG